MKKPQQIQIAWKILPELGRTSPFCGLDPRCAANCSLITSARDVFVGEADFVIAPHGLTGTEAHTSSSPLFPRKLSAWATAPTRATEGILTPPELILGTLENKYWGPKKKSKTMSFENIKNEKNVSKKNNQNCKELSVKNCTELSVQSCTELSVKNCTELSVKSCQCMAHTNNFRWAEHGYSSREWKNFVNEKYRNMA